MGHEMGCHVGHEVGCHVGHDEVRSHVGHVVGCHVFCWLRKYSNLQVKKISNFALGDVGHGVRCHGT